MAAVIPLKDETKAIPGRSMDIAADPVERGGSARFIASNAVPVLLVVRYDTWPATYGK